MSDKLKAVEHEMEMYLEGKESKAQAFKRLVIPRVENALDRIRILSNLADTARYEYTQQQIDKIEAALLEAIKTSIEAFRDKGVSTKFEL